jgi:uncharacterized protein
VTYLLHTRLGPAAEQSFVDSIAAGELDLEPLRLDDFGKIREVMRRYPQLGFVDASIVAIAVRLKIRTIATTDRRHFRTVVSKPGAAFQLVP